MKITVCTLFERHYHFGVAGLVNSLCASGFTGSVIAGFRGSLPPWAAHRVKVQPGGQAEMEVTPDVRLHFVPLETTAHLTNYKPRFLLQAQALAGPESEALLYLDPDIVINSPWRYFQDWLSCGVAVCEDINSPLALNHPRRIGWRRFFHPLGFDLAPREIAYANGGLVGLRRNDLKLLEVWEKMTAHVTAALGGDDLTDIEGGRRIPGLYGFADCFRQPDQDALNAAMEACPEIPVSFLGRQAMGFEPGRPVVPHASGFSKPWQRHYLLDALNGFPPTVADKYFWAHAEGPILSFPPLEMRARRVQMTIGAALGRFIRRT